MKIEDKVCRANTYIKLGNYVEYLDFSLFAFLSPIIFEIPLSTIIKFLIDIMYKKKS